MKGHNHHDRNNDVLKQVVIMIIASVGRHHIKSETGKVGDELTNLILISEQTITLPYNWQEVKMEYQVCRTACKDIVKEEKR